MIFGKNPFEKLYPASITKTMTALLAIKYGNLSDEVTVPEEAVITESGATLCGIKPSDKLTMEQLLYGLMLPSGNFVNPHGLNDENHYTTAYDLYLIFNEAMKYPDFRKVIGTSSYDAVYATASGDTLTKTWKQSNWYMTGERDMPEGLTALGGKTGTTKAAGSCLIMGSSGSSGMEYISVVLKAPDRTGLYDNMSNILNKIVD